MLAYARFYASSLLRWRSFLQKLTYRCVIRMFCVELVMELPLSRDICPFSTLWPLFERFCSHLQSRVQLSWKVLSLDESFICVRGPKLAAALFSSAFTEQILLFLQNRHRLSFRCDFEHYLSPIAGDLRKLLSMRLHIQRVLQVHTGAGFRLTLQRRP